MKKSTAVKTTRNFDAPALPGKYHRLMCMTGKNKGLTYYLQGKRVVLGRSETADIPVLDSKSSREHIELALVGVSYVLTDLGSHNGVVVNDLKVNQHKLVDNDRIIIGQTVFKYNLLDIQIAEVEDEDEEEDEEEELRKKREKEARKKRKKAKGAGGKPKKMNKMTLGIVGLLLVFLILTPEEGKKKGKGDKKTAAGLIVKGDSLDEDVSDGSVLTRDVSLKVSSFIHRGQREFRERNYFRAKYYFQMALVNDRNNGTAHFYMQKTDQKIREYVKTELEKGGKQMDALKYEKAIKSYCNVITYYQDYKEKDEYTTAEKQIEVLEERLGKAKGEIKCIEK
jgi:pSer/pThr/pTyr-binding forkhead associated (FHA) protein